MRMSTFNFVPCVTNVVCHLSLNLIDENDVDMQNLQLDTICWKFTFCRSLCSFQDTPQLIPSILISVCITYQFRDYSQAS